MNVELNLKNIREILYQVKDRNIVCFGAGTAGKLILDKWDFDQQIKYFTDNNEKIWGQEINNIKIINPKELLSIDNVFIIIISRHVLSIKQQLMEYGFCEEFDFIDMYSPFEIYFRCEKAIEIAEDYIKFVTGINEELLTKQNSNQDRIGIAVLADMPVQKMFFQITLYLILKIKNYNVELILDFIGEFSDINYFDGANNFLKELIIETINRLELIYGKIKYIWLEEENCELSEEDNLKILINVRDTVKHYNAYTGHRQNENFFDQKYERINKEIKKHVMSLKTFLLKENYDVISVISGVIDRRWNYNYLGHFYGVRVPSYDMDCWSTDFPACWNYDLKNKLVLSEEEIKDYAEKGKKIFNNRKNNNEGKTGYRQLANYKECHIESNFDILIPLNVMFDGAVFGLDKVFASPEEWIVETVKFLYKNTNATILIRESPVDPALASLNYSNYSELLIDYIDNKRIFYSDRKEKVNIYKLIENSKIILPYSSTIGIEAAIMNKPVVIHTSCFYEDEEFVFNTNTKNDYFDNIIKLLYKEKYFIKSPEKALALFYIIHSKLNKNSSQFCEGEIDWIYNDFQDVCKVDVINNMVNVIAENKMYFNK